ncbi:MAG: glycosyltransferase family 2 protein [Burkholderiales bacterium]
MSDFPAEPHANPGVSAVLTVIVNFNSGDLLLKSVKSLKCQTFTDYRLIVVDNASKDDSIDLLLAHYPDVEVLHAEENLGFAAANNLAARVHPNTPWIVLLNPDAFPEPDWLQRLVEAAEGHPECAAFASCTLIASEPSIMDGAGDAYHVSGRYWRRENLCPRPKQRMRNEEIFSACAAAALYARDAWDEVGGLDEDFFCYGEDVDLGFRLQLAGHKCLYVPEAIVYHEGSAVTGRRSDFSTYYSQRNLVWVYVKNMPSLLFWALLPYHMLLNIAAMFACLLRGQAIVVWKAKRDAIRWMPRVWRKRSLIQRMRRATARQVWKILERGWPGPRC